MIEWLTAFVDQPAATFEARADFWQQVTGSGRSPVRGPDGEFATLEPASGHAYLRVQRLLDGEGGTHLDLHVRSSSEQAARAVDLGATVMLDDGHTVLRTPGGMVFCLVDHHGECEIPPTVMEPTPHRLDQVSIDIPAARYESEVAFWSALTTRDVQSSRLEEFRVIEHGSVWPLRLLLQRLGPDDPAETPRAHFDLACGSDRTLVADHHTDLGARHVGTWPYWITMEDPGGVRYCLTHRPSGD